MAVIISRSGPGSWRACWTIGTADGTNGPRRTYTPMGILGVLGKNALLISEEVHVSEP